MTISRFACLLAACLGLGATAPASARSLDDILKAGELRVGVNPTLPPRALFNEKNEIDGFEPELAKAVAEKLGVKLTTLTKSQADYLGCDTNGPYKADQYRY